MWKDWRWNPPIGVSIPPEIARSTDIGVEGSFNEVLAIESQPRFGLQPQPRQHHDVSCEQINKERGTQTQDDPWWVSFELGSCR